MIAPAQRTAEGVGRKPGFGETPNEEVAGGMVQSEISEQIVSQTGTIPRIGTVFASVFFERNYTYNVSKKG